MYAHWVIVLRFRPVARGRWGAKFIPGLRHPLDVMSTEKFLRWVCRPTAVGGKDTVAMQLLRGRRLRR